MQDNKLVSDVHSFFRSLFRTTIIVELSWGVNRIYIMGRRIRVHFEGAVYHAMSRGNGGQEIFLNDGDRQEFLMTLAHARVSGHFRIYAYCLMSNHFHLLIRVGSVPLPQIMQLLLTQYATRFNLLHHKTGHLFQSRYKAILCTDDSYLLALIRYIHWNPVRAGLVEDPSLWPWSSHRQYLGAALTGLADTDMPLSILHERPDQARTLLRDFVSERPTGVPFPCEPPAPGLDATEPRIPPSDASVEGGQSHPIETLADIGRSLAAEFSTTLHDIRGDDRRHALSAARRALVRQALRKGFRAAQIARFLNRTKALITKYGQVERVNV